MLIIFAATVLINAAYIKLDKSDPDYTKKFETIPSSIKVCNFGSSHGLYGFHYKDVKGMQCFNFALVSQTLSYDKRLFDYYKDNIAQGAVVFIPVSYFSFFGRDERSEDGFAEKNKRYYRMLSPDMIKDYDLKTDIYVNYLPSLSDGENLIKGLLAGYEDTNDEIWSKQAFDIDVKENAKDAYKRHIIKHKFDKNGNRMVNHEEIGALISMINSCQDIGAIPVLITTPFLKEYTDEIRKNDAGFFDEFYGLINEILDGIGGGVMYYDYAFDERFITNYEWFRDADHLNRVGACQFVNILMDEIVHYGDADSLLGKSQRNNENRSRYG